MKIYEFEANFQNPSPLDNRSPQLSHSWERKLDIRSYFVVYPHDHCQIVLKCCDGSYHILKNLDSRVITCEDIEVPIQKHILSPYCLNGSEKLQWCFWDPETSEIKLSHNQSFSLACGDVPKLYPSRSYSAVCFSAGQEILIVDYHFLACRCISAEMLAFEVFDHVEYFDNIVAVWSTAKKSDGLFKKVSFFSNSFRYVATVSWHDSEIVFNTEIEDLKIFPSIRRPDNDAEQLLDDVFLIFR